jgi:uncharacterized protein (UPF0548 family)
MVKRGVQIVSAECRLHEPPDLIIANSRANPTTIKETRDCVFRFRLTFTSHGGYDVMFLLLRPTDSLIRGYLDRQSNQTFSYDSPGCTRTQPAPRPGWNIDAHRVLLGHGEKVFHAACAAIDSWEMFPEEIARLCWPQPPREDLLVAVLYRVAAFPVFLLMPARIVYTIHDTITEGDHAIERHGFAYGTLPDHIERGEERFLVEWNHTDGAVHYEVLAMSQPRHALARLAYPFTRHEQARFRRLSGIAMQRAAMKPRNGYVKLLL